MIDNLYKDSLARLNNKELVFFGTGKVAQSFYQKYCVDKKLLPEPIYWCDNNKAKQGTYLHNIEIISTEKLCEFTQIDYKNNNSKNIAIIIASTSVNLLQMLCQIEQMGIKVSTYSAPQIDAYYYFNENSDRVESIIDMLEDEKSKYIYQKMINNMKYGNCIDFSIAEANQYLDNDVISKLDDDEVIVDAGVCNGEEIDKALQMNANIKIYAFEPDHNSMLKLKEKYNEDEHVHLLEYALWNEKTNMNFDINIASPSASRIEQQRNKQNCSPIENANVIHAVSLDEIIKGKVTFIKMDIEGAEHNALLGAEKTIKKYQPKLAICVYHSIEDYIELPLMIKQFNPNYKFYFRQHSPTSSESVIYAI